MDEHGGRLLADIITAIGTPSFVETASGALCRFSDFELSSVILHRSDAPPQLMFEDLASIGCRQGIENYIRHTYRANPMLRHNGLAGGICRARDFRLKQRELRADLRDHLICAPEEELGFRTVGWPAQQEELGLYFGAYGGIVELSLYRERGRRSAPAQTLQVLNAMRTPLAAAFNRHAMVAGAGDRAATDILSHLSTREGEVAQLLLTGCSSEAIALRLGITRYTVKDYRKQIFRKLRISSLAELFALAAPKDN